jgi:hypothetical protein
MDEELERLRKLFPRIYNACQGNDLAIQELRQLLQHLELLQDLNTQYRLRKT